MRWLSISAAGFATLLSIRYFVFAYQGLIDRHIPAYKRRAFDIDEAIGNQAAGEGWRMLAIGAVLLLIGIGLGIYAYRYEDDV